MGVHKISWRFPACFPKYNRYLRYHKSITSFDSRYYKNLSMIRLLLISFHFSDNTWNLILLVYDLESMDLRKKIAYEKGFGILILI